MSNGWTGGQYSVFRALLGLHLLVHFLALLPWGTELFSDRGLLPDAATSPLLLLFPNVLALADSPLVIGILLGGSAVLSVLLAIGRFDRLAAIGLWYVLACLHARNPLIANPSLPFVGWMLLAHAALPPAPYGSLAARGRVDPSGGWSMPPAIFAAAWIVMAIGYSYSGWTKLVSPSWVDGTAIARVLENPLARPTMLRGALLALPAPLLAAATWGALAAELLFAPLALVSRLRPWIWAAMLAMHVSLVGLIDFAELSIGMILVHLFTFDPAWVRPLHGAAPARVFYDGDCALCHGAVRFLLAEARSGSAFRFAPLSSETFASLVPAESRVDLPDSIVVVDPEGRLRSRAGAVLFLGAALGGLWRLLAIAGRVLPAALADRLYDALARRRRRLFGTTAAACPILPPHLRSLFDP
jgi:predicted DCC family thiol-disulfide oxidoreductase YuxK